MIAFAIDMTAWGALLLVAGAIVIGLIGQAIGDVRLNWHWAIVAVFALVGGLVLWAMGLQFYIPLALALLIFAYGGTVIVRRGQPTFILMYFMFVIVGAGGLMVTATLAPIAQDLKIAGVPVSLFGLTMSALTLATMSSGVLAGTTSPDQPADS